MLNSIKINTVKYPISTRIIMHMVGKWLYRNSAKPKWDSMHGLREFLQHSSSPDASAQSMSSLKN
jgi:hypothetical protein